MPPSILIDSAFWITISITLVGCYKFSLTQLYRSKCSNFKLCCGLINVERDIKSEMAIDVETIHSESKHIQPDEHKDLEEQKE